MMRSRFLSLRLMAVNRLREARSLVIAIGVLLGTHGAWAACYAYPGATEQFVNIAMGNVIIRDDVAVDGVIATRDFALRFDPGWFCDRGGGDILGVVDQGSAVTGSTTTYSTAVPGVGIRVSLSLNGGAFNAYPNKYSYTFFPDARVLINSTSKIRVELIKTAAVTGAGPLAAGTYTRQYGNQDRKSLITTRLAVNGTTLVAASCGVDLGSRNIPVQFGKVSQSEFKGQGTPAAERNFNIQLNCRAGSGTPKTVMLRMDALTDTPATPGVLSLTTGTDTARGVGIQVLDGNRAPVKFGENADVGPAKDGSYVLPYTARYCQTGTTVTPGQANGTATFTLDYR